MSKLDQLLKRVDFYEKVASQAPKANALLNKAAVFERLALYSDRKSFLEALAQTPPGGGGVKEAVGRLATALDNWFNTSAPRQEFLGGLKGYPQGVAQWAANIRAANQYPESGYTVDLIQKIMNSASELAQVNKNLRNEDDDVRHSWVNTVLPAATDVVTLAQKQIAALNEWRSNIPQDTGEGQGTGTLQVPETTVTGTPPPRQIPINKADQAAVARLFESLVASGDAGPVADTTKMNDGVLGNETRKALEAIKDYYGKTYPAYDPKKGGTRMTDQQAIQAAKFNK